ncbi:type II toxin-antitoxin system RelE/ParE family toxin [Pseudomonas sp. C27(2019)]|uniref:type II toxin-antitoxin system RelE/ParE family toxin n=1 Tax=Pseudomonas sp. C27(2019) TaxID=2604941 RepID=UPI0012458F82|nr:type II toxin-antitoxin system RelE/ParE family toxin [Pseudomonas sp. C27(2019)]QEY59387.1 type II toxin-antitoxin system RelE/ParE family toxin [Pseudomonas sp. C27(2019)]
MQPVRKVRVTPRARDDLKNIGRYTERTWGKAQRNHYLKSLDARFDWLAENPQLGKHRPDICEGYHSFPEGQHVVFYLLDSRTLDIIGIPHKEMDTISYFQEG